MESREHGDSIGSLRNVPKLSTSNWSTFSREFLYRTVTLDDAHTWLQTGIRPDLRIPQYDDLIKTVTPSTTTTTTTTVATITMESYRNEVELHVGPIVAGIERR